MMHVFSNRLKKIVLVIANLCNMQIFANVFVRTVLTDLLDTSCQELYPIVNIAMSKNFKHCHVYTTRFSQ